MLAFLAMLLWFTGVTIARQPDSPADYAPAVERLGHRKFEVRERAMRQLSNGGHAAATAVARWSDLRDLEVYERVLRFLDELAQHSSADVVRATVDELEARLRTDDEQLRRKIHKALDTMRERTSNRIVALGGKVSVDPQGVTHVTLYKIQGNVLAHLKAVPRLDLTLSGPGIADHRLLDLKQLDNIQRLDVRYSHITDALLPSIAGLPRLESLYLSRTKITDAGLTQLKNAVRLKELFLSDTAITSQGLAVLEHLPHLERLSLRGCALPPEVVEQLRIARPRCVIAF